MNINVLNYGSYNVSKINIQIFNKNKLLINDYINKKTFYNLPIGIYIIKLYINKKLVNKCTIIHKNKLDNYNIYLNCNNKNIKTFYLFDYFYTGLKIQKGEINLGTKY